MVTAASPSIEEVRSPIPFFVTGDRPFIVRLSELRKKGGIPWDYRSKTSCSWTTSMASRRTTRCHPIKRASTGVIFETTGNGSIFMAAISWFNFVVKAKSLSYIMNSMQNARFRIGMTGTVKDTQVNLLSIEGHFGPTYKAISTKELMDRGQIAQLQIRCIVISHPEHAYYQKYNE